MSALETPDTAAAPVLVRRDGPAARITLNRPEQAQRAVPRAHAGADRGARRARAATRSVRAIVIEGAGPAFSAGHDLGEMIGRDVAFYQRLFDVCTELMETVHRAAAAGDRQGARHRDRRRLPARRRVRPRGRRRRARGSRRPACKIGLFCSTPMVPLSRAIGRKRALEMLLTGADRRRDGARLGPRQPRRARRGARRRGRRASSTPSRARARLTVGIGKQAFYAQIDLDEHARLRPHEDGDVDEQPPPTPRRASARSSRSASRPGPGGRRSGDSPVGGPTRVGRLARLVAAHEHEVVLERGPLALDALRALGIVGGARRNSRSSDGLTANTASESRYSLAASKMCVVTVRWPRRADDHVDVRGPPRVAAGRRRASRRPARRRGSGTAPAGRRGSA